MERITLAPEPEVGKGGGGGGARAAARFAAGRQGADGGSGSGGSAVTRPSPFGAPSARRGWVADSEGEE